MCVPARFRFLSDYSRIQIGVLVGREDNQHPEVGFSTGRNIVLPSFLQSWHIIFALLHSLFFTNESDQILIRS